MLLLSFGQKSRLISRAVSGLLIGLAGCGHVAPENSASRSNPESSETRRQTVRVAAAKPERKQLVRTIELPGRVEAYQVAPLQAKVTGYVGEVPVDIGDRIKGPRGSDPGMLLCQLHAPELKDELAQKSASVAQVKAEVLQADAGVKVAESAMRSAAAKVLEARAAIDREESRFARWQSEYKRVSQLAESGAVTKKVADETRSEMEVADAGRKETAARVASAESEHAEAVALMEKANADAIAVRSHLAVAEAEQRRAATMIEYTTIRAPFDGVVVERNVHTGHLVPTGLVSGGKPLFVVMSLDPVRVVVDIPETDAVFVNKGTKVELKVPSTPGEPFKGTVTRTSWSLNSTSRTLTAEVDVPNADGRWRPGQYAQAKIVVAELDQVLSLPKSAILFQEKQSFCMVVGNAGIVSQVPVVTGIYAGSDVEIRDGLTGEENVIFLNPNAFRAGQEVEITAPQK